MKIIGEADDGYIVKISKNEAYNLNGFYWYGSDGAPVLRVGSTFEIHKMYNKLTAMQPNKKELDRAAKSLRDLADNIEVLQREIGEIIEE